MVIHNLCSTINVTVEENMSFGLKVTGVSNDEIKRRVGDVAKSLQLVLMAAGPIVKTERFLDLHAISTDSQLPNFQTHANLGIETKEPTTTRIIRTNHKPLP